MELEELERPEEEQEKIRRKRSKEDERIHAMIEQEDREYDLQRRAKYLEEDEMERNKLMSG
jgi:hypothetical protein